MRKLPDFLLLLVFPFKVLYYFLLAVFFCVLPDCFRKMKRLTDDVVLVTGGGSGIGRCLALQLAKTGAQIVIWDINGRNAETVSQEIKLDGGNAHVYVCDVSDRLQVYQTAGRVRQEVGQVTVLVNNAGVVNGKLILETPDEDVVRLIGINTLAHFWTVKAFLPFMLERNGGHIVTIASVAGYAGICRLGDYCASKAAAISFHETLSLEILSAGKKGVCTTLVCPYLTRTGLFAGTRSRFPLLVPILDPDLLAKKIIRSILLKERHLVLPGIMRFLLPIYRMYLVPRILPAAILESPDDIFGAYSCMNQFVGNTSPENFNTI